jgi:hypothetical protein
LTGVFPRIVLLDESNIHNRRNTYDREKRVILRVADHVVLHHWAKLHPFVAQVVVTREGMGRVQHDRIKIKTPVLVHLPGLVVESTVFDELIPIKILLLGSLGVFAKHLPMINELRLVVLKLGQCSLESHDILAETLDEVVTYLTLESILGECYQHSELTFISLCLMHHTQYYIRVVSDLGRYRL